jgi:hypothetical protein
MGGGFQDCVLCQCRGGCEFAGRRRRSCFERRGGIGETDSRPLDWHGGLLVNKSAIFQFWLLDPTTRFAGCRRSRANVAYILVCAYYALRDEGCREQENGPGGSERKRAKSGCPISGMADNWTSPLFLPSGSWHQGRLPSLSAFVDIGDVPFSVSFPSRGKQRWETKVSGKQRCQEPFPKEEMERMAETMVPDTITAA